MTTATATMRQDLDPRETGRGGLFRLLTGTAVHDGPAGCPCVHCHLGQGHHYESRTAFEKRALRGLTAEQKVPHLQDYTNDLIHARVDLVALHGAKFERLDDSPPPASRFAPRDPDLEDLKLAQLFAVAEDEGIDLGGATKRADVIAAIRLARGG